MENEVPPDNLKDLWQNQNVEPIVMSLEELRRKAAEFQKRIRHRNLREYVASGVVLVAFSYYLWRFPAMRLACSLILAGTLYVMYQLHTKGAAKVVPESLALDTCLAFHQRELERQRDLEMVSSAFCSRADCVRCRNASINRMDPRIAFHSVLCCSVLLRVEIEQASG